MRLALGVISVVFYMGCSRAPAPSVARGSSGAAASPVTSPVGPASARAAPLKVPPQTAEDCRACRGDWGKHGLAETPSCNCRTHDGGKRCTEGADCEGVCIAAESPEVEIVDQGPPARGYFAGRCSELVTVYGCNRILDGDAKARGPVKLDDPPQALCVD